MISAQLSLALAHAKVDDLRRAADTYQLTRRRAQPEQRGPVEQSVTLRFGSPADQRQLARLAELDSSTPLTRPVLLAEVGGQLRAALALTDGTLVGDPVYPTADLIDLLRARARQLDATPSIKRSLRLRSWFAWPRVELSKPQSREQRRSPGRDRSGRTAELFEPRPVVRLRARAHRLKLDRALAAGADPSDSPLLAARAAQLVDPSTRTRIAACLEQFAFTANRPPSRVKTLPLRDAVRPNQQALLELARALRREQPTYARGIAMLHMVLSDGTGPAYTDPSGERLARQLELAAQGLSGRAPQIASS